jgi:hypothetical protein
MRCLANYAERNDEGEGYSDTHRGVITGSPGTDYRILGRLSRIVKWRPESPHFGPHKVNLFAVIYH